MKRSVLLVLAMMAVLSSGLFAQKPITVLPTDTLASYGTHIITAGDFLERFELMPWPMKDNKARIELTKQEFLESLVAEKMLSLEAQRMGVGNDTASLEMQSTLQRIFTRDEVYKRDVREKVRVSTDEIREGLKRFASEMKIVVYGLVSKKEGDLLLKKLAISKNKEKTFEAYRDSLYTPLDTVTVTFGALEKPVEDVVYKLKVGELSKPINTPSTGWRMLKIIDKYPCPKYGQLSGPDQITEVKKLVSQRREDSLATRVFAGVLGPQRAEADPVVFKELADSVLATLARDSAGHNAKDLFIMSADQIERLEERFGSRCGVTFVMLPSGNMTLGEVINGLKYNQVVFPSLKPQIVQAILSNNIKTVIQNELIARDGVKRNYQQSENVRHDLSVWMDNRRARLLMKSVGDTVTVSDDEIMAYYHAHAEQFGATIEVNVKEILVDSVSMALDLRKRLDAGEDFAMLAKKYSKRQPWAKQGGVSGFFNTKLYPELGLYATSAVIGKLVGPLKIAEGLTIFSVIDRRIQDDSLQKIFDTVKQNVRARLLNEKKQEALNQYLGSLGRKYHVVMNNDRLRNLTTTSTSMVTWRTIGFGGRILAVPMASPQSQWVREMYSPKTINQ